jgi:CBS-domain-containing membrane protein
VSTTVKDVMSTHVMAVREHASYKEIATILHEQRISAFPVIDDHNKVIGVVSEADLLAKEALGGTLPRTAGHITGQRERSRITAVTAAGLMTRPR